MVNTTRGEGLIDGPHSYCLSIGWPADAGTSVKIKRTSYAPPWIHIPTQPRVFGTRIVFTFSALTYRVFRSENARFFGFRMPGFFGVRAGISESELLKRVFSGLLFFGQVGARYPHTRKQFVSNRALAIISFYILQL